MSNQEAARIIVTQTVFYLGVKGGLLALRRCDLLW
jgi:hypothetical protein